MQSIVLDEWQCDLGRLSSWDTYLGSQFHEDYMRDLSNFLEGEATIYPPQENCGAIEGVLLFSLKKVMCFLYRGDFMLSSFIQWFRHRLNGHNG